MSGYSGAPLRTKLGLKDGMRTALLRLPAELKTELSELDPKPFTSLRGIPFDYIHYFASSTEQLEAVLPNLKLNLKFDGSLWISWAKRSSPLFSGLGEADVRRLGLATGLVDVKVVAVTDDWSGLKFVYRLTDRK